MSSRRRSSGIWAGAWQPYGSAKRATRMRLVHACDPSSDRPAGRARKPTSAAHSAAARKRGITPTRGAKRPKITAAITGETLFPIIRKLCQTVG